jgi:hypothetical protein
MQPGVRAPSHRLLSGNCSALDNAASSVTRDRRWNRAKVGAYCFTVEHMIIEFSIEVGLATVQQECRTVEQDIRMTWAAEIPTRGIRAKHLVGAGSLWVGRLD